MKLIQVLRSVMLVCVVVGLGSLSIAAEKERALPDKEKAQGAVHTVQAGVGYPTNAGIGIQAEKQPGEFIIPKGSLGTKLKYSFYDPKSGYTSTKLRGSNIYSVTEKRYMHELDHNPDFELPPGDYKFVVGGSLGATGTLSYTTVPTTDTKPPTGPTGPPKKHHPSPPTDTAKSGDPRAPLHPGGEGTRKVTVHMKTTQINKELPDPIVGEGDGHALLSVKDGTFVLEFQPINAGSAVYVMKWEGTVDRNGTSLSVKGKTHASVTVQMNPSGTTIDKATGTFTGKLAGNRLSGTAIAEGTTTYSYNPLVRSYRRTVEWYIDDFAK